ncbi:MAG: 4-hydroxy-tetrahydrodipicolinate reductase [Candidatus Dormibacteria bacterium]
MAIRVCVAGATGWTGSAVTGAILTSGDFKLVGAIARRQVGRDIGETLGHDRANLYIVSSLEEALATPIDVLIDYTGPEGLKDRILVALGKGVRVVVGSSGLTATEYAEIAQAAQARKIGVIAAGNFSITAALAKHMALMAARYAPAWEIIDYADAGKVDAPSGTTRELAEELASMSQTQPAVPLEETHGSRAARGATIGGTQVHSLRLPGYTLSFEAIFGLPGERLSIRHDAGAGAEPYVSGTLLAARKVLEVTGLVRGFDRLLFRT